MSNQNHNNKNYVKKKQIRNEVDCETKNHKKNYITLDDIYSIKNCPMAHKQNKRQIKTEAHNVKFLFLITYFNSAYSRYPAIVCDDVRIQLGYYFIQ